MSPGAGYLTPLLNIEIPFSVLFHDLCCSEVANLWFALTGMQSTPSPWVGCELELAPFGHPLTMQNYDPMYVTIPIRSWEPFGMRVSRL